MVLAEASATQPAQPGSDGAPGPVRLPLVPRGRGAGRELFPTTAPTDEQWNEVEEFLRENAPLRLKAASSGNRPIEVRQRWKQLVYRRFLDLKRLQNMNPELYEQRIKMIRKEDRIFGLSQQFNSRTISQAQRDEIRSDLRTNVADLFQSALAERERRLKDLQELVAAEMKQVAEDRHNQDKIIADYVEQLLVHPAAMSLPEGDFVRRRSEPPATQPADAPKPR